MALRDIASKPAEDVRQLVDAANSAVVRVEPDGATGFVVLSNGNARQGSRLRLVDGRSGKRPALADVLAGNRADASGKEVPRTGPGDVILFESAYQRGEELLCGPVAARMHDGMRGPVQAMRVLARPTALAVTNKGAIQSVKLADPASAERISDLEGFLDFARRMAARPFPGGSLGFILRNAHKPLARMTEEEERVSHDLSPDDRESLEAFVRRLAVTNEVLKGGAIEAIPTWRMPLAGAHMFRERVDLKTPVRDPRVGAVSRHYSTGGSRAVLGYQPSFVILADDDEWTFGARSGRRVRTCLGLEPLRSGSPLTKSTMPSAVRDKDRQGKDRKPLPALYLFQGQEAVVAAAEARAVRRGEDPSTAMAPPPARTPARNPAPGRGEGGEGAKEARKTFFPRRGPLPPSGATTPPLPGVRPRMAPPARPAPKPPGP